MDDLQEFDEDLCQAVQGNTKRYHEMFSQAIDDINIQPTEEYTADSILDVFIQHRTVLQQNAVANAQTPSEADRTRYPPSLLRRYQVYFEPPSQEKRMSIRQVEAEHIGKLVQIEGIVIRATQVKPQITVVTYACDVCHGEIYQEVTGPSYMPKVTCDSETCTINSTKGRLQPMTRGSKFTKFQELKIQELSKHVPTGHVPRSMTIHASGDVTRSAAPGDQIIVSGAFYVCTSM